VAAAVIDVAIAQGVGAGSSVSPVTKAARQARIVEILWNQAVGSQTELAQRLAEQGLAVTQATLSRDLIELRAEKVRSASGALVYAVPGEGGDRSVVADQGEGFISAKLSRQCQDLLVSANASANLVVLRTPPGAASFLGSAIDHSSLADVLGCIAGDDTILVISRDPEGGERLASVFLELAKA
jgi:transcriptional regulator of arginine metabolism